MISTTLYFVLIWCGQGPTYEGHDSLVTRLRQPGGKNTAAPHGIYF